VNRVNRVSRKTSTKNSPAEHEGTNRKTADLGDAEPPKQFNVLSFVAGLVFIVGGLSFLGQQNGWFTIDLGTVLPIVAIVGGLGAIFGNRRC
jgi:hypothetical protein